MSNTLCFNANPKYSLTESILFAVTNLSEISNLDRILVRIDGKNYEINRDDKITDIMENWCRIKFDIEDEINLPFKDDNCKFHFYATLLNKDYFAMALYTINFAINVDKYIKEMVIYQALNSMKWKNIISDFTLHPQQHIQYCLFLWL